MPKIKTCRAAAKRFKKTGTGAWTGSLVASLLEVDLKKSVPAILLGLCMATVIMCIVGYGALGSILS